MFSTVFTFASHPHTSAPTRLVLVQIDDTIHQALARVAVETNGSETPSRTFTVSIDPHDCFDSLVEIVSNNDGVVRIECDADIQTRRVVALHLCVDTSCFLTHMTSGGFPSEASLITLARAVWRDAHLAEMLPHTSGAACDDNTAPSTSSDLWRHDAWTLFPHQRRSLAWMRRMESELPKRITYSGNLHIADDWYLDTETECLTRSPSTREAHLRGGVCANEPGSGKTAIVLRLVSDTARDGNELASPNTMDTFQYASKATLIILPLNLISQWNGEIKKFLRDDVRVLRMVRSQDIRNVTLAHLCSDYDIILTTFYFLRNCRGYTDMVEAALGGKPRARATLSSWARQCNHVEPVLEAVHWRRIVVDEIHGTFDSARDMRLLHLFTARAVWGLTGTPDLDSEAMYTLLEREKAHHPNLMHAIAVNGIRCDEQSAKPECKPMHHVTRVVVSEEERMHMEDVDGVEEEIRLTSFVDGTATDSPVDPEEQFRHTRMQERDAIARRVAGYVRTMEILNNTLTDLESEGETSACGAREATVREITRLDELRASDEQVLRALDDRAKRLCVRLREMEENTPRPNVYGIGTKMRRMGELLASTAREPTILFVQWKSMVRGIRAYLRGIGIRVLHLDGNTSHRESTLVEFTRGGVLVLCMEESFAGLHLAHVHTIVFAHAIVGDVAKVHRLERQAIARCIRQGQTSDVDVYSFLVAESDEETFWKATHPTTPHP